MNVLTFGTNDATGNQVPSPPHTRHVGVALRRLARDVVGGLEQVPLVLLGDGGENQALLIGGRARIKGMLTGKRFRLMIETLAIETASDGKRITVAVPGGEVVRVLSAPRPDDRRMVDVLWDRRALVMFAEDIERRGELVQAATSNSHTTPN